MNSWEAKLTFKIHGSGRVGADGIGLWYKENSLFTGDKTFGGPSNWKGLLIALDTFDNTKGRNSPSIIGLYNDGTHDYNPGDNGKALTIGSCVPSFRGRKYEVYVRYDSDVKRLTVRHKPADVSSAPKECFSAIVDDLPTGYFFGMTAATGGLSDNHDLIQFTVSDTSSSSSPSPERFDEKRNDDAIRENNKNIREERRKNFARAKIFGEDLSDPINKYRSEKYKKIEELEDKIDDILSDSERKIEKTKKEVVDDVQKAVVSRSRLMLDDANFKVDVEKINEYKNKIKNMDSTIKSLAENMKNFKRSLIDTKDRTIVRIKSRSNYTFVVFAIIVQVVVIYVLFSWKKAQKKTNDNYIGFY